MWCISVFWAFYFLMVYLPILRYYQHLILRRGQVVKFQESASQIDNFLGGPECSRQPSCGPKVPMWCCCWHSGKYFMTKLARPRFFGAYLQKVPTINDFGIFRFWICLEMRRAAQGGGGMRPRACGIVGTAFFLPSWWNQSSSRSYKSTMYYILGTKLRRLQKVPTIT